MKLVLVPDPLLRQVCAPVDISNRRELKAVRSQAETMLKIMYKNHGCGLAAPQVGIARRFFVVDLGWDGEDTATREPITLINPHIIETDGDAVVNAEGCLSLPGIMIPVSRQEQVVLEGYDIDGSKLTIEASEFDARCFQHENDHLDGVTLFEKVDPIARVGYLQEYEAALAAGAKPGVYE
jgi:peptide deformylase